MSQEKFITEHTPHIHIALCQGDLIIRSWGESAVVCKGDHFEATQDEGGITVSSNGDLKLMVPQESSLNLETVNGDLVVKYVSGHITINDAHRDAILVGTGSLKINTVHNDISAKNIDGDVSAQLVHGDTIIRNVESANLGTIYGDVSIRNATGGVNLKEATGDISLRTVNGPVHIENGRRDVNLRNLGGETIVENIQGDIRLFGGLSALSHTFTAERDIVLRWPVNAPINLVANAPKIKSRLQLEDVVEKEGSLVGRLGDGETNVTLTANGRIILKESNVVDARWEVDGMESPDFDFSLELEGIGARISTEIFDKLSRVTTDLENKFGPDFSQNLSDRVARKAEQAAAKAERAAQRAAEKAERASERARRRAEYTTRRSPGRPPAKPKPPEPPRRKATGEEQLKILKMVEQGIITPQEAATLLAALES
ncbi:MAG: hypothetical protein GY943_39050 [Chloroflexi bacterium]|nr:hypothetical protein [Chloroflexota bacterium]